MVKRRDYTKEAVDAALSVLLEVIRVLGEFKEKIAIVGGMTPGLLIPDKPFVGTLDIDLALNHLELKDAGYQTIRALLIARGYYPKKDNHFSFCRDIMLDDGNKIVVVVDLLAGEYGGRGKKHQHQKTQDVTPRKARGCDLVFEIPTIETRIDGVLPDGGEDSAIVQVASVVPFIVMKGMALGGRIKEKDAWDIYFVLRNYSGGTEAVVEEFIKYKDHGLVKEGLKFIDEKFESDKHIGPKMVADFDEIEDEESREQIQRDAFERVNYLLEKLGFR